jgi:hypothetical protein
LVAGPSPAALLAQAKEVKKACANNCCYYTNMHWPMLLLHCFVAGPSPAALLAQANIAIHVSSSVKPQLFIHDTMSQFNLSQIKCSGSLQTAFAGPSPAALLAQAKEVKKACANNWAAVELKRKNWAEAANQATKVRRLDGSGPW